MNIEKEFEKWNNLPDDSSRNKFTREYMRLAYTAGAKMVQKKHKKFLLYLRTKPQNHSHELIDIELEKK